MFLLYFNNHVKFRRHRPWVHLNTHYTFLEMNMKYISNEEAADTIKRNKTIEVTIIVRMLYVFSEKVYQF